ncbi:S-layer homology domain-containing protein [Caldicellulosiruptor acetigenus]|uniref:S-layer homology domain-containing protein n=1 Tax=Caldicellulosiruptor acetigenus TaxID=301953 RepID=UPI0013053C7B|nr:S-layer homology domain-containing protein [Caldicellulosiruptor acetigenus]
MIGHWAENEFRWLIEKGIISGVKANGVMLAKPDEKLTRAEAVVIILRTIFEKELLEEEIKKLKEDSFKDISNHWSRDYINVAARYGLVKGYSDKTFRPNQRITREEFVLMVIRVSKYREQAASEGKQNDKKVKFKDVSVNNFGYNEIIFAVEKGLIKGYSDGTFRPRSYISRAEAAVIVARALKADLFITYRAKKPGVKIKLCLKYDKIAMEVGYNG